MIRLVIIEDHPVVGAGMSEVFRQTGRIEVVGMADTVEGGVTLIARERPDVVLSDVMLGARPAGIDLPVRLVELGLQVPVIFFSSYDLPWLQARALRSGAVGYMLKTESTESLLRAIEQVATGGTSYPAQMLQNAAVAHRPPSPREEEIMRLIVRGRGNGEVAAALAISTKTVESHLARLFLRYRVSSRTELVMLAVEQGWLPANRDERPSRDRAPRPD